MSRIFLIASCLAAITVSAANLLPNGGFEEKKAWRPHGLAKGVDKNTVFLYETAAARTGKWGIRINDNWTHAKSYPICRIAPVPGAEAFKFSCWAKAPEGKTQVFRIGGFIPYIKPDGKIGNRHWVEKEFTATSQWQKFEMIFPNDPQAKEVGVLIGATSKDRSLTGTVLVDDAELVPCKLPPKPKKTSAPPPAFRASKVDFLKADVAPDPARSQYTSKGMSLLPGQPDRTSDPAAQPDIQFRQVNIPRNGYYRFYVRVEGPRMDAYARLGLPGFPSTRTTVMRRSMYSGDRREIGVYPMKKGLQTVTLVLPEKLTLTEFYCTFDGPRPLPEAIAKYKAPIKPVGRPRLLITQEGLAKLRKNIHHPENARTLAALRKEAGSNVQLEAIPGCEITDQPAFRKKLIAQAFFAMVENDKKLAKEVADNMHKFMTGVTGFPGSNYFYDIRDVIYAGAIVYDWCYDALTPPQRKEMVEAFYRLAVRLEVSWPPLRQAITIGHGNGGQITIAPLAFAIACFDEDPEPFRIITYRVLEELIPMKAYEYRSPLHPQGSNYGSARLSADLFCATAYRIACGKEIFDPNIYNTHLYWQLLRLPDTFYFEEGDIWGFTRPPEGLEKCLLFCLAAQKDPAVKGFYRGLDAEMHIPMFHLLLNDPEVPTLNPADTTLPFGYHFGPFHGSLIARTGFYSDEAAVYCNGGSKHSTNHQHYDAGAFQIWFRGLLAADIGEYQSSYGNTYDMNFDKRSIAHNMLRVYDPAEYWGRYDNDGGVRLLPRAAKDPKGYENPLLDYGKTTSVSIGPDKMRPIYSFMATDLTSAYSKKIKDYTRIVLFLNQGEKERPASFIVLDLCEAAKAEFPKIFQVSTYLPPVLKPDFVGLANENGGRADMQIYFPKQVKITNYADENSASNPLVGKKYELPIRGTAGHHAHRIEVTPVQKNAFETFLVHFGIRGEKAPEIPQEYTDIQTAHLIRSGKYMVTLPKSIAFVKKPMTFTVPDGGADVLCCYLAPGKWNAAGKNFTVNAGENTLFLRAEAGELTVSPGELAGAPDCQLPGNIAAKANPISQLMIDGKALPQKPVAVNGTLMVPVKAFPQTEKYFQSGKKSILLNGVNVDMIQPAQEIHGELYAPAFAVAGILHASVKEDLFLNRATFTTLPPDIPAVVQFTGHRAENLYRILDRPILQMGRNLNWTAYGKQAQFTAIFDRPTMVSGMEIYYTYGLDRVFPIKLEASMDGKNWTEVFSGKSSQKLNVYRWKPFKMRYLRYVGNGAENSPWTSVERISFQVR